MDAKYTAAAAGSRGYQLCEQNTVQMRYYDQQIDAWGEGSLELMYEALEKLDTAAAEQCLTAERVSEQEGFHCPHFC